MSAGLKTARWWVIMICFLVLIFTELAVILWVMVVCPWAIKGLYIFCTANTTFVVLSLWLDRFTKWLGKYPWVAIKVVVSIVIGFSWLFLTDWIMYDIIGVIGAVAFLSLFPALDFKRMLALGGAMVIYDIIGVYGPGGWIVMLAGGMNFLPPAVLVVPSALAVSAPTIMMLGLGDVIVGGVILITAGLYKAKWAAFAGYVLAIAGAYTLVKVTGHAVPATMFIIPIMLGAIALYHKMKGGTFKELFK
jgi:hypothetical protein